MTGQNIWTGRADISIEHKTISTINGISNAPRWWLTQIQDVSHLKRSKSRIDNCVWKKSPVLFTRQLFLLFWAQGLEPVAAFPFVLDQNRSPERGLRFRAGLNVIARDRVASSPSAFFSTFSVHKIIHLWNPCRSN